MTEYPNISLGSASGAIEFVDWLVDKGYATSSAVSPWRSAMRQVFTAIEGDDLDDVDVRKLDIDEYFDRFENMAGTNYKVESLGSYRSRFRKAIEAYRGYLDNKRTPTFRASARRNSPSVAPKSSGKPSAGTGAGKGTAEGSERHADSSPAGLVEYPFPLEAGGMARLRLPARLNRSDAERLGAFIQTLVFDDRIGDAPRHPRSS
jgi:hypothetical protein